MNSFLLNRTIGSISPPVLQRAQTTRLVHAISPTPGVRFRNEQTGADVSSTADGQDGCQGGGAEQIWAHKAGVNALAIDRFEGRL